MTLVARSADRLGELARSLDDTGAEVNTVEADASSPEDLRARITELYTDQDAPGVVIYNAVLGAPDRLLSSTVTHLQEAYAVDVIGAIVVAQEAAPAMKAAGFGTMIVTGGGFADHPVPALATVSLGKAALRSAATMLGVDLGPDGIRVATLTIAGQIAAGTAFDPARIAERYWQIVQMDDPWQAEFRFTGEQDATSRRGLPMTSFNLEPSARELTEAIAKGPPLRGGSLADARQATTSVRFNGTIHDFMRLNALRDSESTRAAISLAVAALRRAFGIE